MQEREIIGNQYIARTPSMRHANFRVTQEPCHFCDERFLLARCHTRDFERHWVQIANRFGKAQSRFSIYGMADDHRRSEGTAVVNDAVAAIGDGR